MMQDGANRSSLPPLSLLRVEQVQQRWVLPRRVLAVCLPLATAALCLGLAIAVDAWLRGGMALRWALLLLCLAATIACVARWSIPLWRRLSRDQAARLLEQTHPALAGRLITALQLAPQASRKRQGASDALYEQVRRDAESMSSRIDPAQTAPMGPWVRRILAALALLCALLLTGALLPAWTATGLARVLTPWSEASWPQRTRLGLLEADDGARVVRGGTLVLRGRAEGYLPATGLLSVESDGGAVARARFDLDSDGAFTVLYRPVTRDLRVWVEVGDARSETLRVEMVPPPAVERIEAVLDYPAFTGLQEARIPDGNVQAILGTQARLVVMPSKPLASATLHWDNDETTAMQLVAPDRLEAQFEVRESRDYRIALTDTLGFHSEDDVLYHVQMIDNRYPRIELVTPGEDKRVSPGAVLPLRLEAEDDFGVARAILHYRIGESDETFALPVARPQPRLSLRFDWPLAPLGVQAGETVTWWIEVRDEGEHAEAQPWPVSQQRRLLVLDEPDLARWLSDQLEQILDQLAELEGLQAECADAVVRLERALEEAPGIDVYQRARAERWRQERLARNAAQLAQRLAGVAEDYVISGLGQPARVERLQETAQRLATLSSVDMPAVALALDRVLTALQ